MKTPESAGAVDDWFNRRNLTLDLAGLSAAERSEGSILLGGSAAEFVTPEETFDYSHIGMVVFTWGDPRATEVFAILLEHDDNPDEALYLPFAASTVIGSDVWALTVQARDFDPSRAYRSPRNYTEIPFQADLDESTRAQLRKIQAFHQMIGRVGQRWVLFEMSMNIGQAGEETEPEGE